ncbi:TRAP transporter small permease [Salicibibacter kimchii]|uniref:TRAP transporter small permease n=1 Tax=Salicibibacter kimchii TaxID=2099786 RepID=A0A345C470_9BACI|nr:TRAP transporter small permease [Salicibibacter kimchii]AXF58001.1 TRAP transporter small permease [Salicibibacter kimchii]
MTKLNKFLDHLEEYFGVISLIAASGLIFLNVVMRYVFNTSIPWSGEAARYLIIWFIFIGSSFAVRERAHAKVDVLVSYVSARVKKVLSILASFFAIIFCVFLIVSGIQTIQNVAAFSSITPALEIPMYIPYLAIPFGASLMLYRFIQLIVEDIKSDPNNQGMGGDHS